MGTRSILMCGLCAAAIVTAMLLVAGCELGGDGDAMLDTTSWQVSGWADADVDPAEFELTATFSDGEVGGRSAVNQYGGPYRATRGGEFSVGMLTQTLMAGPEPAMRAEETYLGLLSRATAYERDGDRLILTDEEGAALLTFTLIE